MLLNDKEIIQRCEQGMLTPFERKCVRKLSSDHPAISHGISPFGYDVTLHETVMVMGKSRQIYIIDPKDPQTSEPLFIKTEIHVDPVTKARYVVLQPGACALGKCNETFSMPNDVSAIVMTKSTYARVFVSVKTTPIQAGHVGDVVLEIHNAATTAVRLYIDEGIGFMLFFQGNPPDEAYAGQYQGQKDIKFASATKEP